MKAYSVGRYSNEAAGSPAVERAQQAGRRRVKADFVSGSAAKDL